MRVLMLSWEYPPRIVGGISRVVYHLAQELGAAGHDVSVITMQDGDAPLEEKDAAVQVYRVPSFFVRPITFTDSVMQMNFAMVSRAVQLMCEGKRYDILHLHDWLVMFAGKVLAELSPKMAVVTTIHATEYGRNSGIHNDVQSYISGIEQKLSEISMRVIVNSLYMKQEVTNLFKVPENKIRIVPNGVDVDKFKALPVDMELRRQYALDHEKIVFFLGRLTYEKGVHVLMDAIPKVLSRYKDAKFVIGGKGPELENLRQKAWNMGVADKVCLPGFIPDDMLMKMYKLVNIAVFPSLYEPFGIVVLEGMLAHVPVVVSDAGGLNEIVSHRMNGMKFQTGNAEMLSQCIFELLTDNSLADTITRNADESILVKYRWEDLAKKTVDVYQESIDSI